MNLNQKECSLDTVADRAYYWEYCTNAQGQVTYVSSSWHSVTGLLPEDILKDPLIISKTIHPDDLHIYAEHVKNAYEKKLSGEVEYRILLPDSTIHWISHSCEPIFDENGQYAGTRGRNWDITERKNIEHVITAQRDLGLALDKASSLQESLHLCLSAALKVSGLEAGGIYMLDPATGDLNLILSSGHTDEFTKINSKLPANSKPTQIVMAGEPFYLNNQGIQSIRAADLIEEKMRSLSAIPFINKGQVFGSLHVASRILNEIPDQSRHALETIARQIGAAISRAQAEQNLRASEEKYRNLFENANEAIFVAQEGKLVFCNPITSTLSGYSGDELTSRPFVDFIHPADRDLVIDTHTRRMNGDDIAQCYSYRIIHKDGSIRWAEASAILINWKGKPAILNFLNDISERKQAEAALKESESRLFNIIEFLPDATLVIDAEGKVIAWNKAIEQMTGTKAADMLDKGNYEYALPFYGERRPILIDLVLNQREEIEAKYVSTERRDLVLDGEAYMPALRGGEVYLSGRASALRDSEGNIVGAIESIRDITDRRRAEEKYRGIFDNAVMGIFQTTPEGRIISANPAFARMIGYESPEEVVNTVTDMARQMFVNPDHRARFLQRMNAQDTHQEEEIQYSRKDGSTILVFASGRAVRDGAGKVIYYEGTIQDITDRELLESQLRQAQKMEAIGTLAGGIAHDFNNILASMMGYTEMARKEIRQDIRRDYLDQVLQACERAKNLVNQILAFSRRREEERTPVNIRLVLKEALSLLRASLPTTIEIKQDIAREENYVLADPTQIHQIIMNLCTNAAHSMREKGGLLDISLSAIEIIHPALSPHSDLPPGSYVELSVRDTGHGIDDAIKDKIFDPFFTTKKVREGTGLGLSVVYGIVKSCGGAIDVQSSVGQGATFTIYLPRVKPESNPEETSHDEIDLHGDERILFIDDEETLVNMTRMFFQALGYQITATTSSSEALRLFQENPAAFDLVITDMTMPQITGAELSREFLSRRPELPIILCTGYSDAMSAAEARKLNIREFILKPIPLHDLGLLVRRVLKS